MKPIYYFYNAHFGFNPQDYKNGIDQHVLLQREPFLSIKNKNTFSQLILLHQVHGNQGHRIDQHNKLIIPFSYNGDFIYTNQPNIALGIITADCAPIFLWDMKNNVIASIHAGWQGAIEGIIKQALSVLQQEYKSNVAYIKAIIGPCAHACCYEIKSDLCDRLQQRSWQWQSIIQKRNKKIFFDLRIYCYQQLQDLGVLPWHILSDQSLCTICQGRFHSYRRNKTIMRQLSIMYLH